MAELELDRCRPHLAGWLCRDAATGVCGDFYGGTLPRCRYGRHGAVTLTMWKHVILHAVEHHRAIQRGLVAQFNILVLRSDFDQTLAHQP